MPVRPADGIDISVAKLLCDDDQWRSILDELARIGVSQAMETELLWQFRRANGSFEGLPVICEPASAI
jgi:hypothetical protein